MSGPKMSKVPVEEADGPWSWEELVEQEYESMWELWAFSKGFSLSYKYPGLFIYCQCQSTRVTTDSNPTTMFPMTLDQSSLSDLLLPIDYYFFFFFGEIERETSM